MFRHKEAFLKSHKLLSRTQLKQLIFIFTKKGYCYLINNWQVIKLFVLFRLQFYYGEAEPKSDTKFGYTDSGYTVQVTFVKNEYIQELSLDFTLGKTFLTKVVVNTNLRTLGPYGGEGGKTSVMKGSKLMYVEGKSGPLVNQLTAYFDSCSWISCHRFSSIGNQGDPAKVSGTMRYRYYCSKGWAT